jgi:endonuclease/exonuclease/phosphatase family metal-dependent hydrolase
MKLLNLNTGIKISNTDAVIALIKDQQADFVALQEVGRPFEAGVLPEYKPLVDIEATLKPTYPYMFFGPMWFGDAFRTNGVVDRHFGGHIEQGNELLSKYPIMSATNEHYYKHYEYMIDWSNWKQEDHGRSVEIVELDVNGIPLQILNLHGIWNKSRMGDERTMKQCEYIVAAAKRKSIATIITGDFNLDPASESIQYMSKHFRNLITENSITSTRPDFEDNLDSGKNVVDYIFVNDLITVTHFGVIETNASDHLPLIIEFELGSKL